MIDDRTIDVSVRATSVFGLFALGSVIGKLFELDDPDWGWQIGALLVAIGSALVTFTIIFVVWRRRRRAYRAHDDGDAPDYDPTGP